MAKLTDQELQEFQAYRQEASKIAVSLGEIHYQRTFLDLELDKLKAAVQVNASAQQAYLKELGEKYGDGSINVETGEITPIASN